MSRVTYYGYFGPSRNVKDAPIDAAGVDALVALIGALPPRDAPVARDQHGRPLRFIALADLPSSLPAEPVLLPHRATHSMSAANDQGDRHGG